MKKKMTIFRINLILCFFISINIKAQLAGFVLTGNPESVNGATWTYSATVNSVFYNLKGFLYKPVGTGIFPSVIINHGTGGNTAINGYSDLVAKEMVTWGFVCIATNACHMGTSMAYPCGSPGACDTSQWGARTNNFLRTMKVWDILASLAYTDTNCIATYGHSRGAFLTTGLAGTYPSKFSCAGHSAGGLAIPDTGSVPTSVMANNVNIPYIIHHGTLDTNVPIAWDNNLNTVFNTNSVTHQYWTYTGYNHSQTSNDPLVYSRTKTFFQQYMCSPTVGLKDNYLQSSSFSIFPNPASNYIQLKPSEKTEIEIYNLTGELLISKIVLPNEKIDISVLENGIYFVTIKNNANFKTHKLIVTK